MIIYAHSHDIHDAGDIPPRHRNVEHLAQVTVPAGESMADMAERIIAASQGPRSIWLVLINSHGSSGKVHIGSVLNEFNAQALAPLRPYMTPQGRGVEIHACQVLARTEDECPPLGNLLPASPPTGEDDFMYWWESIDCGLADLSPLTAGARLASRLADTLNCPVRASAATQLGYDDPGGDPRGGFEGGHSVFYPHGLIDNRFSAQDSPVGQ